jgi:hypothetical protein
MSTRHALATVLSATVLSATVVAAALSAGCGRSGPDVTTRLAPPAATPAAGLGLPLGTEVTVDGYPGAIGSIRVWQQTRYTTSSRPLSDPPRAGVYLQVQVSARSIGSAPFDFYPYDFYLADGQGRRYEYGLGNGFAEYGPDQVQGGRIRPGERVAGALLFDASPRVDRLVYAPLGRPVQSWQLRARTAVDQQD